MRSYWATWIWVMSKIKNHEDLEKALSRLDEIWIVMPGDDEWDERCDLVDAVVEYEDEYFKIDPPTEEEARAFREDQEKSNDQ